MSANNTNPAALTHMDVAQDELATYAMLLKRAQSSLTKSMQAFERANENSLASDCPTRMQITQKLRQQYAAISNLTDAIVGKSRCASVIQNDCDCTKEIVKASCITRLFATAGEGNDYCRLEGLTTRRK